MQLSAHELDTLTVQDIQEWDRQTEIKSDIIINIIDKSNLTDERIDRLRLLVRKRNELAESRPVDAIDLQERLEQISSRRSSTRNSTPITVGAELTTEELISEMRNDVYENYKILRDIGGRASIEIIDDFRNCSSLAVEKGKNCLISDYWFNEQTRTRRELEGWLEFRLHQFEIRLDPGMFQSYIEAIHRYQHCTGIAGTIELYLKRQTKVDEWREYYIFVHRKRRKLENELHQIQREQEVGNKEKDTKSSNRKTGKLMSHLPAEARKIIKENENQKALDFLALIQRRIDHANRRLERLDARLEWIFKQFDTIANEYIPSAWRNQYNNDILRGWENYILYMYKRLRLAQNEEGTLISEGIPSWPQEIEHSWIQSHDSWVKEKEKQFEALWTWTKLEFPEIALKYSNGLFKSGIKPKTLSAKRWRLQGRLRRSLRIRERRGTNKSTVYDHISGDS